MSLILYLYLIHFLADYPLQPNSLVKLKHKGYWGVFLHCMVHLVVLILLLLPFLHSAEAWIVIAIIFTTHNLIDQAKVYLDKKYPRKNLLLYFSDQIAHLLIVTGVAIYAGNIMPRFPEDCIIAPYYMDQSIVLYLLILVLVTYFYDVTRYFVLKKKKRTSYKRDYKIMIWNAVITTVAFTMYWLA